MAAAAEGGSPATWDKARETRAGAGVEEQCGAAIQFVNKMRPLPRPTATVALSNLARACSPSSFFTRQERSFLFRQGIR